MSELCNADYTEWREHAFNKLLNNLGIHKELFENINISASKAALETCYDKHRNNTL